MWVYAAASGAVGEVVCGFDGCGDEARGGGMTDHETLVEGRDPAALLRFIIAVSPFVRDVLDEPFPWKTEGQVIVRMSRWEYDEAVAALEALRD